MFDRLLAAFGRAIVKYITAEIPGYKPTTTVPFARLRDTLEIGDVLLVEGNTRVATAIKYLTQSTWSHSAVYVGDMTGATTADGEPKVLIEVDVAKGCVASPLSEYAAAHTRICRPVGLGLEERRRVARFMIDHLGTQYDMRNVIDLARYLVPTPPVPVMFRRRMIALGSGDPTRAICSTLIAEAFAALRYPVLPEITWVRAEVPPAERAASGWTQEHEILHIRHYSLYTPRDFDLSPYFAIVKPTIEGGFDYRLLEWGEPAPIGGLPPPAPGTAG
ncbi:MAG TPA: lipo-like protein [Hyphomicrobiales bacterium]|nr:lipo-like protein [Hyphomicrobiales bacterium]